MKKALVMLIAFLPMLSYAKNYGCATAGASMEISLFEALSEQLSIDTSTIVRDKTQVKILDITPVSRTYAEYLARFDFNHYHGKDKTEDTYNSIFFPGYYENDVKSITAQYTYFNNKKKKAVFIATSLMNKDECSIRFNGYITLSREF
ncbi:Shiga toxin A subunit [Atlantibacter hermannii]|uniref:Shiga toxin A subunit n=1 Tax=Atlantibacter hermannii TaxID=565 RepID=UPI0028A16420|nr:Shiga toxin A subunit [Atlantibacter hermannii]